MCRKLTFKAVSKQHTDDITVKIRFEYDRYSKLAQTVSERQTRVPLTITASPLARDHATLHIHARQAPLLM